MPWCSATHFALSGWNWLGPEPLVSAGCSQAFSFARSSLPGRQQSRLAAVLLGLEGPSGVPMWIHSVLSPQLPALQTAALSVPEL